MTRTQITMDANIKSIGKARAKQNEMTFSEYIRYCILIENDLAQKNDVSSFNNPPKMEMRYLEKPMKKGEK